MKILCALGEHNYGDVSRGMSYEYVNFLPATRNLGHQISFFDSLDRNNYRDFGELNRQFLQKVQVEKPDVIFCVLMHYEIWFETLQLVRECTGAILINWSTDDSWKYQQFSKFMAPVFHIFATTYQEAMEKLGRDGQNNVMLTQWAANAGSLTEPLPAAQCKYKVSFIGTAYGNRPQWIASLGKHGINVDCFGHGWKNGSVPATDIPAIMRDSIISLNFGDSGMVMSGLVPGRSRQIKARIFEVPGAGGFLLTEYADGLGDWYKIDTEICAFDGLPELVEKINFYLTYPEERDCIAMAGYIRTRDEHTYELRLGSIFNRAVHIMEQSPKASFEIDFTKFNLLEKRHATGFLLKLLKSLLLIPCVFIWGRIRGRRAARRLLFELSWRLVGKKTYSVTGWPGRLFYKES